MGGQYMFTKYGISFNAGQLNRDIIDIHF